MGTGSRESGRDKEWASRPADERKRRLMQLQADVQQVRAEIAYVNEQTGALAALEAARSLTSQELERERALRREVERLYWQLRQLVQELHDLQHSG
jgi:hypothetical protein